MRWLVISALLSTFLPLPVGAETAMSAEEFEAYTTGKTLYFGRNGKAYGVEKYLANRHVRWSFLDGKCQDGIWYEDHDQICFVYDNEPSPQCWTFFKTERGLTALFENNPEGTELYEAAQDDKPMYCLGPEIGV